MFPRIRQEVSIAPEPSALRCSASTTCVEVRQHLNQVETKPFQFSIFPYELLMFYSLHSAAPSCETQSDNLIGMHAYTVASVPSVLVPPYLHAACYKLHASPLVLLPVRGCSSSAQTETEVVA